LRFVLSVNRKSKTLNEKFRFPLEYCAYIPIYVSMTPKPSSSTLQMLVAKWHVFALLAAGFVRLLRRYEDGRAPNAYRQAEQLETVLRAAHIAVSVDIAGALETSPVQTEADARALTHLRFIAVSLLVLYCVTLNVKRRLRRASSWVAIRNELADLAKTALPARLSSPAAAIDSS